MTVTIPISVILDDIYASASLQAGPGADPVLDPDNAAALRRFIIIASAETAASLGSLVTSMSLPSSEGTDQGDIVITLDDSCAASPEAVLTHLNFAVSFAAMAYYAICQGDDNRAKACSQCAADSVDAVRRCLTAPPPSLSPLSSLSIRRYYT